MSIESLIPSNHLILCLPLLLLPSIFPSIKIFPMGWFCASDGQNIGASASAIPKNSQGWFPLGLMGLISLLSKAVSRAFSNTAIWKHDFFGTQPSLWSNSHPYMTTGKTRALTTWIFVSKVMSLLFNTLSNFVIAFLLSSKCLLISWLQSPSIVILEPKKI